MKKIKAGKIFVQIASYRDPELLPTLRDCIEKAKFPENLVFSISWQHSIDDKWDNLDEFKNDPRFKIIDIDYRESNGACWARNTLQQQYDGEEYTLQLDSHHRFVKHWDYELIKMYNRLRKNGSRKPLITSYASSFEPTNDPGGRENIPWKMDFDRFTPEGYIFFIPSAIDEYKELDGPVHGRFYSAHYAFTTGKFVEEVPHDPEFYFHGEEISIAVRAFTWGYDIYHPHKCFIWHEYMRDNKSKQWDDDKTWSIKNNNSHKKLRRLFGMDGEEQATDMGIYGFGPVRTLHEYEIYAGVSFSKRGVQQYTLDRKHPPNPLYADEEQWEKSLLYIFKHCIDLYAPDFPEPDYDFWVVSFEKMDGTVINRRDADRNEVLNLIALSKKDNWIRLWREFAGNKPDKWVVWPHSVSKEWCERVEGIL